MLPRFRRSLDGKIEETLRFSYDGLGCKEDKAIFRHIACLFNHVEVEDIKLLLADSELDVQIGLNNLVDKSLIHMRWGKVEMHCLLEDMGKEIVRAQSHEPGEREFLVESKDICTLLEDNTGTKKIIGISLDMDEGNELRIHKEAFKGMRNLLFLKIHNPNKLDYTYEKKEVKWHLPEGLNYLPPKLRFLSLDGYQMRCMPSSFRPENLVKLQMPRSKLEKLWDGVHSLSALKIMDMSGSENLREIPDLSKATNLERLDLERCSSLVELPSSIQYLNKLIELRMSHCENLETLPTEINLRSLDRLYLNACHKLRNFPDISTNISTLSISHTVIQKFPFNLRLEKLVDLSTAGVVSDKWWEKLQRLAPFLTMLPPSLMSLRLCDIPTLVELPSSFQCFPQLNNLQIENCINLKTLPIGINLEFLDSLVLDGCSGLKSFPCISTNISQLSLNGTGIEEVPWWIQKFCKLEILKMKSCDSLIRVSHNIYNLEHLSIAAFSNCGALTKVSWNDSPSALSTATVNIHSEFPEEHSSSLPVPDDDFPEVEFDLKLDFTDCFKVDQEALLQQPSGCFKIMILSGEEVPSYFTYRTTGTFLNNIPLFLTSPPSQPFIEFRVCASCAVESISTDPLSIEFQVCFRFTDMRLGNHFYSNWEHDFLTSKLNSHLFVFDCGFVLPQLYYDLVDIQFHSVSDDYELAIKGWGVKVISEDCTPFSADTQTGIPNIVPRVCEADEIIRGYDTEHGQACTGRGAETERSRKRIKTI